MDDGLTPTGYSGGGGNVWGKMTESLRLVDSDLPVGHTGGEVGGAAGIIELESRTDIWSEGGDLGAIIL